MHSHIYIRFTRDAQPHTCAQLLTPARALVTVTSKAFEKGADKEEKWYKTKYKARRRWCLRMYTCILFGDRDVCGGAFALCVDTIPIVVRRGLTDIHPYALKNHKQQTHNRKRT